MSPSLANGTRPVPCRGGAAGLSHRRRGGTAGARRGAAAGRGVAVRRFQARPGASRPVAFPSEGRGLPAIPGSAAWASQEAWPSLPVPCPCNAFYRRELRRIWETVVCRATWPEPNNGWSLYPGALVAWGMAEAPLCPAILGSFWYLKPARGCGSVPVNCWGVKLRPIRGNEVKKTTLQSWRGSRECCWVCNSHSILSPHFIHLVLSIFLSGGSRKQRLTPATYLFAITSP